MTTHIALIRGINVGPSKRVAMAALRDMLSGLGYQDVRTHLNSGNAVFRSNDSPAQVAKAVEKGLADELKVPAQVVVRSRDQLVAAMAADPLTADTSDGSRHFLGFLAATPKPGRSTRATLTASPRGAGPPGFSTAGSTAHDSIRIFVRCTSRFLSSALPSRIAARARRPARRRKATFRPSTI